MKKIILLTSLLASIASIASGTTGTVETYNSNETIYLKGIEFNESFKTTKSTIGVKTEVKVNNTGLSFGADIKAKEYTLFTLEDKKIVPPTGGEAILLSEALKNHPELKGIAYYLPLIENVRSNSLVWAKYDLPEMNNIMSYVKGTYKTEGKIEVEGDASYKLAEKLSAGLNSKTEFDFSKTALTSDKVTSVHKAYLKGEYDKVKDIYAQLGVTHTYETEKAAKNVFLNAKATYEATKDLALTGKIDFKHTLNNGKMEDDSLLFSKFKTIEKLMKKKTNLIGKYRHSYLLSAKYTGIKDTELKLDAFIEHNYVGKTRQSGDADIAILNFGFKPEITYKGIENLVLSSKNVLAGSTVYEFGQSVNEPVEVLTLGYIKLNANAEYTYKATDKFTVKPSLDLTTEILTNSEFSETALTITPKLAAEYKPSSSLTISGDIAPEVMFVGAEQKGQEFGYIGTNVKSSINVKYTW